MAAKFPRPLSLRIDAAAARKLWEAGMERAIEATRNPPLSVCGYPDNFLPPPTAELRTATLFLGGTRQIEL